MVNTNVAEITLRLLPVFEMLINHHTKETITKIENGICGFDGQKQLRLSMERQWKMKVNFLRRNKIFESIRMGQSRTIGH